MGDNCRSIQGRHWPEGLSSSDQVLIGWSIYVQQYVWQITSESCQDRGLLTRLSAAACCYMAGIVKD